MWENRFLLIILALTMSILATTDGLPMKNCGNDKGFGGSFVSPLGKGRGLTKEEILQIGKSSGLKAKNEYPFYAMYLDALRKRRASRGRKKFESNDEALEKMAEEEAKIIFNNYEKGGRQLTSRPFCKCSKPQPQPQTTEAPQKIPRNGQIFNFDPRKPVRRTFRSILK